MNYAHIYLVPNETNPLGVIGEVPGENGQTIKGTTLVDVMTQVAKFPAATAFLAHCAGPGGDVEEGDKIHDYFEALKAEGKVVDTTTEGDIGSILTKIYMVGQTRSMTDPHKFYVHAPWVPHLEGNATQISKGLQDVYKEEAKLHDFYKQKTGINSAGLKGLMDGTTDQDGTFMTADQAVALKFATKKIPSKLKAYAQLKNMANNETLGQKVGKLLDLALGNTPAPAPTAAPTPAPVANVPLEMEGGMKLISSADDPANLVGSTLTDEAGQPVQDGEHKLTDGRVLVVTQGKIADVKAAAAAAAPPAPGTTPPPVTPVIPAAAAPSPTEIALQAKVKELEGKLATMEQGSQVAIDKAISELKDTLVAGKTPVRAFNNNGHNGTETKTRTIGGYQAFQREERKKQINKN